MPPIALQRGSAPTRRNPAPIAWVACLALPVALLHARALAEIMIVAIDLLFLAQVWIDGDVEWLKRPFTWAAAAWWVWLAACSVVGSGGLALGLAAIRLPLLSVALGDWLLAGEAGAWRRRWLWWMLVAAFAWIALQCWQQHLLGTNLFGQSRWIDGALTGPFNKPRAGPAFILLFFPVVIPGAMALWSAPGSRRKAGGVALFVASALTLLLIGQRMPSVLLALGLAVTALLLPRMRLAVLAAGLCGGALVAALPIISPAANDKLVVHFADQLRHFADSDYGLLFVRGYTLAELHPWLGRGFDGFRRGCSEFWTMHGIDWLGIATYQLNGGMRACNLHPHNYYLEAADNAGLPGLALFVLVVATALYRLAAGLQPTRQALRTGLLVGMVVALWPLATTSSLFSMPNGGWVFLLLGFGFSASRLPGPVGLAHSGAFGRAGYHGNAECLGNAECNSPFQSGGTEVRDMGDETTTDHGFIRAWAEARDGRPGMLEGRTSASGAPLLRFDFGTPEPGLAEIAWDEFFEIFESDRLALEFRESPGHLSRFYKLVPRSEENSEAAAQLSGFSGEQNQSAE